MNYDIEQEIQSWDEADEAIRGIYVLSGEIEHKNTEATLKVQEVKKKLDEATSPLSDKKDILEKKVTRFCKERKKSDFKSSRTKKLKYGEVGWRRGKKVSVPTKKEKVDDLIKKLRNNRLGNLVTTETKINRDGIRGLNPKNLIKLGLTPKYGDSLRIKPYTIKDD